jgi:2-keto-4-pentenoate hydratase
VDDPVLRNAALALTGVVSMLAGCVTAGGSPTGYVARFLAAERGGMPFDPVTASLPATTFAQAYGLQTDYIRQRLRAGDRIAGYKGGLMSAASMKARNVTEPLVGTLFASGRADNGSTITLCGYRKASFELKLGYVIDGARRGLPASVTVLPVIDLPDIAYRDPDHYGAVDMVAANVSAARYVRGTPRPIGELDLDAIAVTLTRDGRPIASGIARESLGNQLKSVDVVLDLARKNQRKPARGDLIVTGKIGDRGWLLPGDYVADYGPLGRVGFTVADCRQ